MSDINGMYGRTNADGNISVWSASTGAAVTFMPADVKPVGSQLSARKNHPKGIVLTRADALAIGLEIRGAASSKADFTRREKKVSEAIRETVKRVVEQPRGPTPDPTGQTFKADKPTPRPFGDQTLRHDRGRHVGPPPKTNR